MTFLLATLTFCTIAAVIQVVRADSRDVDAFCDQPRRLPDPSPRDLHAITGTLDRAPVPSWG